MELVLIELKGEKMTIVGQTTNVEVQVRDLDNGDEAFTEDQLNELLSMTEAV